MSALILEIAECLPSVLHEIATAIEIGIGALNL